MKRVLLVMMPFTILISACGAQKSTTGQAANRTTRAMKHKSDSDKTSDEVVVTGTQYVPVYGKNEAGVRPDLQGVWELDGMPGVEGGGKTNSNNITTGKSLSANESEGKPYSGRQMSERMKTGKEVGRDSVTTKNPNGTETTTTVYIIDKEGDNGNKITPPQSSNPNIHIPEKPHLSFFGANDTFSGFTGCNKISGRYTMKGNSISFQNASASTKMVCIGEYDEIAFLNTLHRVNSFKATSDKLELMEGDNVLLVFSRK